MKFAGISRATAPHINRLRDAFDAHTASLMRNIIVANDHISREDLSPAFMAKALLGESRKIRYAQKVRSITEVVLPIEELESSNRAKEREKTFEYVGDFLSRYVSTGASFDDACREAFLVIVDRLEKYRGGYRSYESYPETAYSLEAGMASQYLLESVTGHDLSEVFGFSLPPQYGLEE
ncbi:MAG: hypothetical protein Fur003_3770 [Candidatus Dojkabacteria bacterium]